MAGKNNYSGGFEVPPLHEEFEIPTMNMVKSKARMM